MIVPRNIFEISELCESGHTRFALDSVRVGCTGGRGFAYATNGCQVIAADWEGGPDPDEMLVSRVVCERVTTLWQSPTAELIVSPASVSDVAGSVVTYEPSVGKFPRFDKSFVEPKDSVNVNVDLRLLQKLVNTMVAMAKGTDPAYVTLSIDRDKLNKVWLTSSVDNARSMGNVAGILMCVGKDGDDSVLPSGPAWFPGMKERKEDNEP